MLEQNTDRLYWIIGAVVVGSLLILIAYNFFPDLFKDDIKKKFTDMLGTSNDTVAGGQKANENKYGKYIKGEK